MPFVEINVLTGGPTGSKAGKVIVNTEYILMAQGVTYESQIVGLESNGTQIHVNGIGHLLVPFPYDKVSQQLLTGKPVIGPENN